MNGGDTEGVSGRNGWMSSVRDLVSDMHFSRATVLPALFLAVIAFGSYVFLEIAEEMAEGEMHNFDNLLFLALRNPADPSDPLGPPWLEEAAVEITALGGYPLITIAVGVVVGFLLVSRRYGPAIYVFVSVASGAIVSQTLKEFYSRPRPDIVKHLDVIHTSSFPSGHALVTTVAYLTLGSLIMRLVESWRIRIYVLAVALAISVIVGVSRVYLGVHWPTDVIAGWALGAAWASLSWLIVSALQFWIRRRQTEQNGH